MFRLCRRVAAELTVNLGVRSETHGGMSEVQNNLGGFNPNVINPVTNTLGSVVFAGDNGAPTQSFETKTKVMPRLGWLGSCRIMGGAGRSRPIRRPLEHGHCRWASWLRNRRYGHCVGPIRAKTRWYSFPEPELVYHYCRSRPCYLHHPRKSPGKRIYTVLRLAICHHERLAMDGKCAAAFTP